ncbi:MAG: PP2C family serine/threonine-protein phosphatase, partial [Chloroflexota bacterium]
MNSQNDFNLWRVIGASVRGTSHVRANAPNQDALRWLPASGDSLPLVVALSDGHGSAKSFRSQVGARIAVETATHILAGLAFNQHLSTTTAVILDLPQTLVQAWRDGVEQHLNEHSFSDEEWARLAAKDNGNARALVEANPWLAYGATLLAAVVTHDFILYLQLGDGDILSVSEAGEVCRPRWPKDARLFANETTSLCMDEAWREMQMDIQTLTVALSPENVIARRAVSAEAISAPREGDCFAPALSEVEGSLAMTSSQRHGVPALIVLATDGYANSFADENGFLQVGSDLLELIRSDGLDAVNANLSAWLDEASQLGSGDDITLAIVSRM